MSSHYIYVSCPVEECKAFDSLYTGDQYLDDFDDDAWEGETIHAKCKNHNGSADK